MTFAYWNRDFLDQAKLLNSQTGEYLPVEIEPPVKRITLGTEEVAAERYNLRNGDQEIDISIWYHAISGRWLSLESRVDGRVIRYLPERVHAGLDPRCAAAPRKIVDQPDSRRR